MRHYFILLVSIACLFSNLPAAEESRSVTIDDYFQIKSVGDPQISPDGKWVAYTVSQADIKKDKYVTQIRMVPYSGGEAIQMTAGKSSASKPRWSPDGKYLTFLADRDKSKTQVWALNRLGGEARQWTKVKQGVSNYAWSPDGKQLVLVIKDPKPEAEQKSKDGKEKPKPWVVDRLQIKRDYKGYMNHRREHLYLSAPNDTNTVQLTFGDYDDSDPVWSPDGKTIAFVSNRSNNPDANDNSDIWTVNTTQPGKETKPLRLTDNPGADHSPAWSPDGTKLAYVTVSQPELIWYATDHLAVINADGSDMKILTEKLDQHVSSPRFSADGRHVYFEVSEFGARHLARIRTDGTDLSRPVDGKVSVRDYTINSADQIAVLISNTNQPREIYALTQNATKQITHENDALMKNLRLASASKIQFKSADGTQIEAFLYLPSGHTSHKKLPTLLRLHGGPVGQYDYHFNFDAQLFAANGYAVILPNPRGSLGYGQDFSLAIWRDWGNKDFQDVMAAVDAVVKQGIADENKLGVGGWSYGGMLTDYVITKTNRFKAAISGASEVLYVANYGTDHYQYEWEAEMGLPWENRKDWERISPFNQISNVKTPTLIMGGEKDWNVPILNSEQLYQSLRRLGVPTELVVYPGEHHGIRRPSFQKDRYERYLDWYGKYLNQ